MIFGLPKYQIRITKSEYQIFEIKIDLKKHSGISTNKFIIRRYSDMDSSYWFWKYPDHKIDWQLMRQNDSSVGSTGDVFPLDELNKTKFDRNSYFLIRLDSVKNNR